MYLYMMGIASAILVLCISICRPTDLHLMQISSIHKVVVNISRSTCILDSYICSIYIYIYIYIEREVDAMYV